MFGIGGSELVVIVIIALLVFGPQKIPEVARAVSRAYKEWTKVRSQVDSTITDIKREIKIQSKLDDGLDLNLELDQHALARPGRGAEPTLLPVPSEDDYLADAGGVAGGPEAAGAEPQSRGGA